MTATNENFNLPVVAVEPADQATLPAAPMGMNYIDATAGYDVPAEVVVGSHEHINVWCDGMTPAVDQTGPHAIFDAVLNVSCTDPETGRLSTWKIVKRLAFDKCKLACQAEDTTPVLVVEKADREAAEQAAATAKRFRQMAGLE